MIFETSLYVAHKNPNKKDLLKLLYLFSKNRDSEWTDKTYFYFMFTLKSKHKTDQFLYSVLVVYCRDLVCVIFNLIRYCCLKYTNLLKQQIHQSFIAIRWNAYQSNKKKKHKFLYIKNIIWHVEFTGDDWYFVTNQKVNHLAILKYPL